MLDQSHRTGLDMVEMLPDGVYAVGQVGLKNAPTAVFASCESLDGGR